MGGGCAHGIKCAAQGICEYLIYHLPNVTRIASLPADRIREIAYTAFRDGPYSREICIAVCEEAIRRGIEESKL